MLKKSLHVLILPSWYPNFPGDIRGSFFREQAIALHRHNTKVGVISPHQYYLRQWKAALFRPKKIIEVLDDGVPTFYAHCMSWIPRSPAFNARFWIKAGLKLYLRYVENHGAPDIIHAHSALNGGALALEIKNRFGIPYLLTEHSSGFSKSSFTPMQMSVVKRVATGAEYRLAVSPSLCHLLTEVLGRDAGNWQPISNMVDDRFLDTDTSLYRKSPDLFIISAISSLIETKGIHILLKAFHQAFHGVSNVVLKICGDGPCREELECLSTSLGLNAQVEFIGPLSRDQVVDRLAATDFFVLPSLYETFGVVVVEALALGVPVVATSCGGPDKIVRHEDGIQVPVNNVNELAAAMVKMHNEIDTFNPQEIRAACRERFSSEVVAETLSGLYRKALMPPECEKVF